MDKIIEWITNKVKQIVAFIAYTYLVLCHYYGFWVVNSALVLVLAVIVYIVIAYRPKKAWKKKAGHPKHIRDLSKALEELFGSKVAYGPGYIEVIVNNSEMLQAANICALALGNRTEEYQVSGKIAVFGHKIVKEGK